MHDVRYALRMLARHPGWTAVAVLALALGIGANTAIFSIVNAVLLQPLPYPDPDRVMLITGESVDQRGNANRGIMLSVPKLRAIQEQNRSFENVAGATARRFSFSEGERPEQVSGARVTANFFDTLGVHPLMGRFFSAAEDAEGGPDVAVVGYSLWQRSLGGDRNVLGRVVTVDGRKHTIVGVLPPDFEFYFNGNDDLYLPRPFEIPNLPLPVIKTGAGILAIVARLRPGVSMAQAQAELNTINARYRQTFPNYPDGPRQELGMARLGEDLIHDVRPALLILQGAVALVLLIACANVANLLLVRTAERRREVAVRLALGASRGRLLRQWLVESGVLSVVGAALGIAGAWFCVTLARNSGPASVPRLQHAHVDAAALLFAVGLAGVATLVFGIAPSFHAARGDVNIALQEAGRSSTGGARANRTRAALVAAEIAISLVLLVGSALLLKSLARLEGVNPGYSARQVFTAEIAIPTSKYPQPDQKHEFVRRVLERVRALPGVESAAGSSDIPLNGLSLAFFAYAPPQPSLGLGKDPIVQAQHVTPGYFATLGIPLLRGRDFSEQDTDKAQLVAIVNEAAARQYWPGQDPIGQRVANSRDRIERVVIGVAADVKYQGPASQAIPDLYLPMSQDAWPTLRLVARTSSDPLAITAAVRQVLHQVDPDQPLANIRSMQQVAARSVAEPRFRTVLLGAFAALAFLLCSIGVYGVMGYSVAQRTHELGVRVALGAGARQVVGMVLGQAARMMLIGVAAGTIAAFAATRLLRTLLFGVSVTDPLAFVAAVALLAGVALLASYVPARRAAKVDPMVALREP